MTENAITHCPKCGARLPKVSQGDQPSNVPCDVCDATTLVVPAAKNDAAPAYRSPSKHAPPPPTITSSSSSQQRTAVPRVVGDIMTRKVATLFEGETLEQAIEGLRMVRFRHVPVVGPDGYLIGLVSQRDLLRALPSPLDASSDAKKDELLRAHRVGDIMTREVRTVSADTLLDEAGQVMIDEKRDCLPVKDEQGNLIGLVTATDYVRLAVAFLRASRG